MPRLTIQPGLPWQPTVPAAILLSVSQPTLRTEPRGTSLALSRVTPAPNLGVTEAAMRAHKTLSLLVPTVALAAILVAPSTVQADYFGIHIGSDGFGMSLGVGGFAPYGSAWNDPSWSLDFDLVLDGYGEWVWVPGLGRTWRPYVVGDWRPYTHGRWVHASQGRTDAGLLGGESRHGPRARQARQRDRNLWIAAESGHGRVRPRFLSDLTGELISIKHGRL